MLNRQSQSRRAVLLVALTLAVAHLPSAYPVETPIAAEPKSSATARTEFVAALQRIRQRIPETQDSTALRHYVIYDYLVAARLRRDLELRPGVELDDAIDAFLQAHSGEPVSRNLRADWLSSLAARKRWDWFLPRSADATSPQLVCDRLAGRLENLLQTPQTAAAGSEAASAASPPAPSGSRPVPSENRALANEALTRWNLPQKSPPECEPVFAWLRGQGLLTPDLIEARARAALAVDNFRLARELAAALPADRAAPVLQWAQLLESPRVTLVQLADSPATAVEPAAVIASFSKLARTDATIALAILPRLATRGELNTTAQVRLQQLAALGAAYSRDPASVEAFKHLPDSVIDNDVREWRVRAALWAGDFAQARTWIDDLPQALATQPRWRYWRARVVEATAGAEAAAALYADVAGLRDYYGYLAADRLHRAYDLNAHPTPDDATVQNKLAAQPGMVRAHALFDCDLNDEAQFEWAVAMTGTAAATKVQAARLASRWGWYSQAIATLAQAGELDDVRLRYPRPYTEEIAAASKLTQMPTDWILAVMRQESLFREDAVSRAGARGLMQMTPATAAAVAKRWHLPMPDRDTTSPPGPDVARGAAHLRDLLDKYGQLGLTLAAYNAGAMPVARWMPLRPMDADIWVENIPYGETRGYVQRIVEHIVAFAWVRDADLPRLATLLPPVPTAFPVPGPGPQGSYLSDATGL